eukprot:jgi/Tetstr1/436533/TSEL_025358.t1
MASGVARWSDNTEGEVDTRRHSSFHRFINKTDGPGRRGRKSEDLTRDPSVPAGFHGPLAGLYPAGVITRPEQRHSEQEWARVMAVNPDWLTQTPEASVFASMWQALLIASDLVKEALAALFDLETNNKAALRAWMLEAIANSLQRVSLVVDMIWECHTKQLLRMTPEQRQSFPENLETMHLQVHKKLAMLTQTMDGAVMDKTISRAVTKRVSEDFVQCSLLLRNLAQLTLEDALFFYRSNATQVAFMARIHVDALMRNEEVCNLLVGATPPAQRQSRFKQVMGLTNGSFFSGLVTRSMVSEYEKNFNKPLEGIIEAATT